MEQKEIESIIDSIGSERNVEYENEINHVYAQIRVDELEDKTLDFSIEDISNLSDSSFDSNEEIKSNESFFSKFILDIKDTLTEKKIKDNFSESVMFFFKKKEIPKALLFLRLITLKSLQIRRMYQDGSPNQTLV